MINQRIVVDNIYSEQIIYTAKKNIKFTNISIFNIQKDPPMATIPPAIVYLYKGGGITKICIGAHSIASETTWEIVGDNNLLAGEFLSILTTGVLNVNLNGEQWRR